MPAERTSIEPRDAALRALLVATADARSVAHQRHPRLRTVTLVAALIAALSVGAVSGAAVAAASGGVSGGVARADAARADPATVAASAIGAEVLHSIPSVIGPTRQTIEVGSEPVPGARLQFVVRCSTGYHTLVAGDAWPVDLECPATGVRQFAVGYAPAGYPVHTVDVATDDPRFALTISWISPAVTSEESRNALADGVITDAEYVAAFERYSGCMTAGGWPAPSGARVDGRFNFPTSVQQTLYSDFLCYPQQFQDVDVAWQAAHEVE